MIVFATVAQTTMPLGNARVAKLRKVVYFHFKEKEGVRHFSQGCLQVD